MDRENFKNLFGRRLIHQCSAKKYLRSYGLFGKKHMSHLETPKTLMLDLYATTSNLE